MASLSLSHLERAPVDRKQWVRLLFAAVLEELKVARRLQACFAVEDGRLRVGSGSFELGLFSRVLLAAVGKAAIPMAEHALAVLRPVIPVSGVVVGPGAWTPPEEITYFLGGHPLPNDQSFAAGDALLAAISTADADTLVVFLISGGASAMAEVPLDPAIPRAETIEFYRLLLHSGLTIESTNALRKHLSAIKGGRLALAAAGATCCTLLIADVPAGRTDVVGSGLSLPDSSTVEDCRRLLAATPGLALCSPRVRAFFDAMPETPKALPAGRLPSLCHVVLSSDSMVDAARRVAAEAGYRVVVDNGCDDWEYRDAAAYLLRRALEERSTSPAVPVCVLSAGEVTVSIAGEAGRGGRNQQWALEMARLVAEMPGVLAMSAGSDGIDGNSPAAGAVVDGATWSRALAQRLDPQRALDTFDAYPVFAALSDALVVGPSGNNIRDLRMILVHGISAMSPRSTAPTGAASSS